MAGFLRESVRSALRLIGIRSSEWRFRVLPFQPIRVSKETWESQYATGQWERLTKLSELAHYSVIVGYCQHFKKGGSVLDVGCGEGLLQERLKPMGYARYVGIDISAEAIRRAALRQDERTAFECVDATAYIPPERFGTIVFNEALYYFENPLQVLAKYQDYLEEGGIMVVSMHATERTKKLWQMLENRFRIADSVVVSSGPGVSWMVKAIRADAPPPPH